MVAKKIVTGNLNNELSEKSKKLVETEHKQTEVLIDAIKKLSERFDMTKNKPKGETKAPGGFGTLKDIVKGKVEGVKDAMSPAGLLEILAAKSGGGLLSTVLSGTAESIREKKSIADKQMDKKMKFVHGMLSGTQGGRELVKEEGIGAAAKKAAELFEKNEKLQNKIDLLESKQKELKDSGVSDADLSTDEKKELNRLRKQKEGGMIHFGTTVKPQKGDPVNTQLGEEFYKRSVPLLSEAGEDISNPDFMSGVRKGIEEELLKVNEEQLEALKSLIKAATVSEEDKFEAENKKRVTEKKVEHKEKIAKEEKPGSSLLDMIKDKFIPKMPKLGNMAAGAARFALPGLALGGAAAAGVGTGMLLNKYVLNPAAGAITGDKSDTVGTALHKAFNGDFDEKMKTADAKAEVDLAKSKISKGEPISKSLADKVSKMGVVVPPNLIVGPKRPEVPYSNEVRRELNRTSIQVSEMKDSAKAAAPVEIPPPAVITNNNSSNTTIVRPDVRSREPTYNRILAGNVAY